MKISSGKAANIIPLSGIVVPVKLQTLFPLSGIVVQEDKTTILESGTTIPESGTTILALPLEIFNTDFFETQVPQNKMVFATK